MTIELYYDSDCPLVDGVRDDVRSVLEETGLEQEVVEHVDEDRLSPTLLVHGRDPVGDQPEGRGCRLARPTRDQIRAAITGSRP